MIEFRLFLANKSLQSVNNCLKFINIGVKDVIIQIYDAVRHESTLINYTLPFEGV